MFVLIALFIACDELEIPNKRQFVVEAFITADHPVSDIKIKEVSPLDAEVIEDIPIADAEVRLLTGESEVMLNYNPVTEKYFAPGNSFPINVSDNYQLEITVDEISAFGSTLVPEHPTGLSLTDTVLIVPPLTLSLFLRAQIQDLFREERSTLSWEARSGQSYFVVIENKVDILDPILPSGIPEESTELLSSFRFISEPSEENTFDIIAVALET